MFKIFYKKFKKNLENLLICIFFFLMTVNDIFYVSIHKIMYVFSHIINKLIELALISPNSDRIVYKYVL